ncbi:galactosylgalactosylxylosylprotein 3-beta-glucuronosyltransferase 2-like [Brevipalpus obovatus]|uniref:galactosylgalactosylxylosylprotein 3-beta-glucuronosyltransferase 2-like n=1 Tax=Brevipalpus obovatus TaxID=246614 RepID=UPI003D9DD333
MRWTSLVSILFLIPTLVIIAIIKIANRTPLTVIDSNVNNLIGGDEGSDADLIYLSNKETVDEIARYIAPSLARCDCTNTSGSGIRLSSGQISPMPAFSSHSSSAQTTLIETSNEPSTSTDSFIEKNDPITIFVITPTYTRATQMADMTRLAQTLMLVKDVFWIVTEDSRARNEQVNRLLNRTQIPYVHLLGPRPKTHLDKRSGRGVSNRRAALDWLRQTYTNTSKQGIIYFADDDNAYDIRIFDEMRTTEKVSIWPVGLLAKIGFSSPIIDFRNGSLIGFHDPFTNRRKFSVDMAGFAVNLQFFLNNPKAVMPYKVGYEEDYFIRSLGVQFSDLEPKAYNCTEILVWHTKTQPAIFPMVSYLKKTKDYNHTNLAQLYKSILQF